MAEPPSAATGRDPAARPGPLSVRPVAGLPELRPGDDLAGLIAAAAPWLRDRDIVAVTSKAVSKVEGRLIGVPADPAGREAARQAAIDGETVRVVASRGRTRIVQTRHGLVLASAGVDGSNVRRDELALLPLDPDASAARLRTGLRDAAGIDVAVVVTDTMGRPWRAGLVDVAIGLAGMSALVDLRGATDSHGNRLELTEVAVADEVAAAAELGKGKLSAVPAAVVRGLEFADDGRGSRPLIRAAAEDLFRLGTAEAIESGREAALAGAAAAGRVHQDATRVLSAYLDPDRGQQALADALLTFLAARPDATRRSCLAGHLTVGMLVVDAARTAVLLVRHPRVGAWTQLGGHVEDTDPSLLAAAEREAAEESGITGLTPDPVPVHLDVHRLVSSAGLPTRHLDVRYVAVAPAGTVPHSPEALELRWFPADALPAGAAADVAELVRRGMHRVRTGATAGPAR